MPHIELNPELPGILGLFRYRPETARPLTDLANVLLRGPSTLTPGERELIAAYVSGRNDCRFCSLSHSAFAAAQLPGGAELVDQVRADPEHAPISPKLRALLRIAAAVQQSGLDVTADDVAAARAAGATDTEIHDAVLIAAMFSMLNRYVDGLATIAPENPALYAMQAQGIIEHGYQVPAEPERDSRLRPADGGQPRSRARDRQPRIQLKRVRRYLGNGPAVTEGGSQLVLTDPAGAEVARLLIAEAHQVAASARPHDGGQA